VVHGTLPTKALSPSPNTLALIFAIELGGTYMHFVPTTYRRGLSSGTDQWDGICMCLCPTDTNSIYNCMCHIVMCRYRNGKQNIIVVVMCHVPPIINRN
jgi:hypothetical protein